MKYESPQTPICSGAGSVIDTSKIFRVGDIVKTVPHPLFGAKSYTGKIDTIVDIDDRVDAMYPYKLKKLNMWIHPNELEHYVEEVKDMEEKEVGKEDNFPTKELNLCELLAYQDLSGVYSPIYGEVRVTDIACDSIVITPEHSSDNNIELFPDGRFSKNGECLLFPSRAIFEKYPLDAYSAWMEWEEARKPKRWRAEKGNKYWYLDSCFRPVQTREDYASSDDRLYNSLDYFRTEDLALQAAEAVRETLMKFHEQNQKK